jgi:hypothetical protein
LSTSASGPFNSVSTSGSAVSFPTAGIDTFDKLVSSGTANLGNITTGTDVTVNFSNTTSQTMSLGGVKTFNIGAGSVVDFGLILMSSTNGIIKNGDGANIMFSSLGNGLTSPAQDDWSANPRFWDRLYLGIVLDPTAGIRLLSCAGGG